MDALGFVLGGIVSLAIGLSMIAGIAIANKSIEDGCRLAGHITLSGNVYQCNLLCANAKEAQIDGRR